MAGRWRILVLALVASTAAGAAWAETAAADLDECGDERPAVVADAAPARGASATRNWATPPSQQASRIFAAGRAYPPGEFAAYGIVAFKARATSGDRARHALICEAYLSAIPHVSEIDRVARADQMVTVWPVERAETACDAARADRAPGPRGAATDAACAIAIDGYDLAAARTAIAHAQAAGAPVGGRGPFLLAWAPGQQAGLDGGDPLVLVADLSHVRTMDQAQSIFDRWVRDIEERPEHWQRGWDVEGLRLVLRSWFDRFGADILVLVGGKEGG